MNIIICYKQINSVTRTIEYNNNITNTNTNNNNTWVAIDNQYEKPLNISLLVQY